MPGEKGKMLVFDVRPWCTNDEKGAKVGVIFYGSKGYMVIDSYSHYKTYLGKDGEPGPEGDNEGNHYENFIAAVRARDASILNAPIIEGHLSSALSHVGLASCRLKRNLEFDPENGAVRQRRGSGCADYPRVSQALRGTHGGVGRKKRI